MNCNQKEGWLLYSGSGEIKEVAIKERSNERFKKGFHIGMEDGYMLLAQLDLTSSQFRILFVLIGQMEYNNYCYVKQSFISKFTGISQPNVSKHISKLVELGLVIKESTPRGNCLRVSSVVIWKGRKDKIYKEMFAADSQLLKIDEHIKVSNY